MKQSILVPLLILVANLCAGAQSPAKFVKSLVGDELYPIPMRFLYGRPESPLAASYDEDHDRVTIYDNELNIVKTFEHPDIEGLAYRDFCDAPYDMKNDLFATQALFNNDQHFEFIVPTEDGKGYMVINDENEELMRFEPSKDSGQEIGGIESITLYSFGEIETKFYLILSTYGDSYRQFVYSIEQNNPDIAPIKGDVNGDYSVDATDVIEVVNIILDN